MDSFRESISAAREEQSTCHRDSADPDRRDGSGPIVWTICATPHWMSDDHVPPAVALTLPRVPDRHTACTGISQGEHTMYYGIGGTVLIVLLVLFFLGRL
jgi:hypothetical protein